MIHSTDYQQKVKNDRSARPLESLEDIAKIRDFLRYRPRDLLLFDLVTQTGLPLKALLRLRVKDLAGSKVGDKITVRHQGEKEDITLIMNERLYQTWRMYKKILNPDEGNYLISSRKGDGPLNITSASHLINYWYRAVSLVGLNGARSLRKTWKKYFNETSDTSRIPLQKDDPQKILAPIQPQISFQERVYDSLFEGIISGRITPGAKLVINRLAKQMNVSNIPVREALHRLSVNNLVSMDNRQGIAVKELSPEEFIEIRKIRIMLEIEAARAGAKLSTDEAVQRLEGLHKELMNSIAFLQKKRNSDNVERYLKLNRDFHHTIYRQAGMPILYKIIEGLWNRLSPYLHILIKRIEEYEPGKFVYIHAGMLEGMERRSPKEVAKWIKEDITIAGRSLGKFLEKY